MSIVAGKSRLQSAEAIASALGVPVVEVKVAAAALDIQPARIEARGMYDAVQVASIEKHLSESKTMTEDKSIMQEFDAAVAAKQRSAVAGGRRPLSHGQAVQAVCQEQPELRAAYVAASNRLAGNQAAANVARIQATGKASRGRR